MTKPKAIRNEKDLKARKEEVKKNELNREADVRAVMDTVQGRRFVWDLLEKTGMFNSRFIEKSLLMYWFAGRRDMGLEIFNELTTVCPDMFWKMQAENVVKPETNEVEND
jgi:hypothetical protein